MDTMEVSDPELQTIETNRLKSTNTWIGKNKLNFFHINLNPKTERR